MRYPAIILVLIGLALAPVTAEATVREWLMGRDGMNPNLLTGTPSVRLDGMGDVALCVPDEFNEINIHDFAGIAAGILDDGDSWTIDTWLSGNTLALERSGSAAEHRTGNSGFEVVYRSGTVAIGGVMDWRYYETDANPGDWYRVRGPVRSAIYNQLIGNFTLGVKIGQEVENENRHSTDFYNIRHEQSRWVGQFSGQYYLGEATLAAAWDFERGTVIGKSIDSQRFHEDTYEWTRPLDRYSIAAVMPVGEIAEAGIRGSFMDRDGGESVLISWSGESPENPSNDDLLTEAITFSEKESDVFATTFWRIYPGGGLTLGALAEFRQWEYDVVEGLNFKGSNREGKWSRDAITFGIGASYRVNTRFMIATQATAVQTEWTTENDGIGLEGTAVYASVTGACEYFLADEIAVRGGIQIASDDSNNDEANSLSLIQNTNIGVSWLPRGGMFQVNGALKFGRSRPWDEDANVLHDKDETQYLFSLRMLL
jgi:hypothetical protein